MIFVLHIYISVLIISALKQQRDSVQQCTRYTPDTRFSSLHKPSSEHWVLELRDTQMSDQGPFFSNMKYPNIKSRYPNIKCSGDYECQISTTPVRSLKFLLQVVGESLNINVNLKFKKSLNINVNLKFKQSFNINVNFKLKKLLNINVKFQLKKLLNMNVNLKLKILSI